MSYEMHVDHLFLRLDGRVFEVLSDQSNYTMRIHVDVLAVVVKGPGRDGRHKVQIGMGPQGGEINVGAGRVSVAMDADQFAQFGRLVELARAARAAGPEPF
jgi:hypothetical protein